MLSTVGNEKEFILQTVHLLYQRHLESFPKFPQSKCLYGALFVKTCLEMKGFSSAEINRDISKEDVLERMEFLGGIYKIAKDYLSTLSESSMDRLMENVPFVQIEAHSFKNGNEDGFAKFFEKILDDICSLYSLILIVSACSVAKGKTLLPGRDEAVIYLKALDLEYSDELLDLYASFVSSVKTRDERAYKINKLFRAYCGDLPIKYVADSVKDDEVVRTFVRMLYVYVSHAMLFNNSQTKDAHLLMYTIAKLWDNGLHLELLKNDEFLKSLKSEIDHIINSYDTTSDLWLIAASLVSKYGESDADLKKFKKTVESRLACLCDEGPELQFWDALRRWVISKHIWEKAPPRLIDFFHNTVERYLSTS